MPKKKEALEKFNQARGANWYAVNEAAIAKERGDFETAEKLEAQAEAARQAAIQAVGEHNQAIEHTVKLKAEQERLLGKLSNVDTHEQTRIVKRLDAIEEELDEEPE